MRGGGMAANLGRLETSKKRLKVRWDHPVPVGEEVLDFQSALKEIRGNDYRPLLVLRDCDACGGKDDALLSKTLDNDKTLLYAQFFHCVKLDRRVVETSHPWHALFAGDDPSHLFMSTFDGAKLVTLDGKQPQKLLWGSMAKILKSDYRKDPNSAVKSWLRVLDSFDTIDSRETELKRQLEEQRAKTGKERRVASIEKKLDELKAERDEALEKEKALMDLVLRHAPQAKTVSDFDAEAAESVRAGSGSGLLDRIRKDKEKEGGDGK